MDGRPERRRKPRAAASWHIAFDERRIHFAHRRDAQTAGDEPRQRLRRRRILVEAHVHHHRAVWRDDVKLQRRGEIGFPVS